MGGSTPTGALGYLAGSLELAGQCRAVGIEPAAIVHTSSSGGTHAGLLAGRALLRSRDEAAAPVLAIGVAEGVLAGRPDVASSPPPPWPGSPSGVSAPASGVSRRRMPAPVSATTTSRSTDAGSATTTPSPPRAGDDAVRWAARHGGWVLDRTYTGKGSPVCSAPRSRAAGVPGDDVVFIHTGGLPAVFTTGGTPPRRSLTTMSERSQRIVEQRRCTP